MKRRNGKTDERMDARANELDVRIKQYLHE